MNFFNCCAGNEARPMIQVQQNSADPATVDKKAAEVASKEPPGKSQEARFDG